MDERSVIELLDRLQKPGVRAWLDGGWGVDALLGTQSRPHSDLDLVILRPNLDVVQNVLAELGFRELRNWLPNAAAYLDPLGRQVDLHPVDPTPDGGGDQLQLDGTSRWHYSAPVEGVVSGRAVLCCPVEDQVACHLGYQPRPSDLEDMRRLAQRFGLRLPQPYAAT